MLRTHRAGKGPGGCGGWGLGSRNRRGPGVPPTPGLRGQGTSPGSPAGFLDSSGCSKCLPLLSCSSCLRGPIPPASPDLPGLLVMPSRTHVAWRGPWRAGDRPRSSAVSPYLSRWAVTLCSFPTPPGWLLPPSSPDLPSASFLCPQGPTQPGGGFGGQGIGLGAQQAPQPEWAGQSPSTLLLLLLDGSSCLCLLISPASGAPILSGFHFSSPLGPRHPTGSLWGSSCLLGHQSPPAVAGRHPSPVYIFKSLSLY